MSRHHTFTAGSVLSAFNRVVLYLNVLLFWQCNTAQHRLSTDTSVSTTAIVLLHATHGLFLYQDLVAVVWCIHFGFCPSLVLPYMYVLLVIHSNHLLVVATKV